VSNQGLLTVLNPWLDGLGTPVSGTLKPRGIRTGTGGEVQPLRRIPNGGEGGGVPDETLPSFFQHFFCTPINRGVRVQIGHLELPKDRRGTRRVAGCAEPRRVVKGLPGGRRGRPDASPIAGIMPSIKDFLIRGQENVAL
jgi:hypothetical protein